MFAPDNLVERRLVRQGAIRQRQDNIRRFIRRQLEVPQGRPRIPDRPAEAMGVPKGARYQRIAVHPSEKDSKLQLRYEANEDEDVGVYVAGQALTPDNNYFEVVIADEGERDKIAVGLVNHKYPLDRQPGWEIGSVAYHADDGSLFRANGLGQPFGPQFGVGDTVGCGVHFREDHGGPKGALLKVFFTLNGTEIGTVQIRNLPRGLFPAVGMHSTNEGVILDLEAQWLGPMIVTMAIDNFEDEWQLLQDVQINGQLIEYTGRGDGIGDVGIALARRPLDSRRNYFEIEITDPGENCYIAIGVCKKDYPLRRHPGWNPGSVAYHADDGKVFVGRGQGDAFGPKCHRGDTLGCGLRFPQDYDWREAVHQAGGSDSEEEEEDKARPASDDEDEQDFEDMFDGGDMKVKIYFTRNGEYIGARSMSIPRGGFYPAVGMLSCDEKVRVDLQPLSG